MLELVPDCKIRPEVVYALLLALAEGFWKLYGVGDMQISKSLS